MDIDSLFQHWSERITEQEKLTDQLITAELNRDSVMAFFLSNLSGPVGTLKERVKGEGKYIEAHRNYLEKKKAVEACKAQANWLYERIQAEKLKARITSKLETI